MLLLNYTDVLFDLIHYSLNHIYYIFSYVICESMRLCLNFWWSINIYSCTYICIWLSIYALYKQYYWINIIQVSWKVFKFFYCNTIYLPIQFYCKTGCIPPPPPIYCVRL